MNILKYPDKSAYYAELATTAYAALSESVGEENLPLIACLEPTCGNNNVEVIKRKWMAIITLSAIINLRVNIGSEVLADVLAANTFCDCN